MSAGERLYAAAMALRRDVASLLTTISAEPADDMGEGHTLTCSCRPRGSPVLPTTGLPSNRLRLA